VSEKLDVPKENISEKSHFINDLGADSLDKIELVMAFEEDFGCEIPDDAAEKIATVGDVITYVEANAA
jgi:acyl carrier protein